ncbi:MAG TPA: MAPEG family protein [Gammaproteobacteria bacterium]|nr:MAPEG family protein [Gammaproteobacteria bacterium]
MAYVYIIIVLALIEYMVFGALVGRAREKYGVKAPAITGNDIFERTFRVHQNTLEGLVIFLPALWMFGTFVSAYIAAGLGLLGIVGRAIYARAYIGDPARRGPGIMICGVVNAVLLLGGLYGLVRSIL